MRALPYGERPAGRRLHPYLHLLVEWQDEERDPPQEFAEQVAEKWFRDGGWLPNTHDGLVSLIATELRAGGWRPG